MSNKLSESERREEIRDGLIVLMNFFITVIFFSVLLIFSDLEAIYKHIKAGNFTAIGWILFVLSILAIMSSNIENKRYQRLKTKNRASHNVWLRLVAALGFFVIVVLSLMGIAWIGWRWYSFY